LYLAGSGCIVLGAILIALSRIRHQVRIRGEHVPFAVAASLLLVGSVIVTTAAFVDFERFQSQRTWAFRYFVEVHRNGTFPVRLHLPAPVDPQLAASLQVSNGTSTLRYESASVASVIVDAVGNVSFNVQLRSVGSPPNAVLTRVSQRSYSPQDQWGWNASLELEGAGSELVHVALWIAFSEFCWGRTLEMNAFVAAGIANYPARWPTVVC